jgi:hypothetical protein
MPLQAQKNKVDGWVGARMPAFQDTQEAWKLANGEYFQGLITHSSHPSDGADVAPDQLDSHPTDRPADWNAFLDSAQVPINIPPSMPAALIFNVYEGPGGWGWECRTEFDYSGLRYSKVWNTGPESGRNMDWVESDPNATP